MQTTIGLSQFGVTVFEHIHIIGSGALGSVIAASIQLHSEGKKVRLTRHVRNSVVDTVELLNDGVVSLNTGQNQWAHNDNALIILPVKSFQVLPALQEFSRQLPEQATILLIHNGMLDEKALEREIRQRRCFIATTTMGAYKPSTTHAVQTGIGKSVIGSYQVDIPTADKHGITAWYNSYIGEAVYTERLAHALWQKLSINAMINPLTAWHDITNGRLVAPAYREHLNHLAVEIAAVMNAEGLAASANELVDNAIAVADTTAKNFSSMHQDFHHGRPTEINEINGYIIAQAEKHGLPHEQLSIDMLKILQTNTKQKR